MVEDVRNIENEINNVEKELFMDEIDKISGTDHSSNSYYSMNVLNKNKTNYKPYTLDDYKSNNNALNKQLPKSLGTNVGSDDWLNKKSKQIKA